MSNREEIERLIAHLEVAQDALLQMYDLLAEGPTAWECYERTMGVWYKRFLTEKPEGERYRNVRPLYYIPAPEPKP